MTNVQIRDATQNDVEAVAIEYEDCVRTSIATLQELDPTTDPNRSRFSRMVDPGPTTESIGSEFSKVLASGSPFIVAVHRGTGNLCGFAYTGPFNERSGYRFTCEDSVYLRPYYHGKGLGRQLLHELFKKLKATTNVTQVIAKISILPEQAVEDTPSCRLHISLGFRLIGRLSKVGYKFGQWVDVMILQADVNDISGPV